MPVATLNSKGQITVPKEVRDQLGWGAGDRIKFIVSAERDILLKRAIHVRELYGLLKRQGQPSVPIGEMDVGGLPSFARRR